MIIKEDDQTAHLITLLAAKTAEELTTSLNHISIDQWSLFLQQAKQQRVGSLLYHKLSTHPAILATLPAQARTNLRQQARQAGINNLKLYAQFVRLLRAFEKRNTPFIGLKGIHIAEYIYSDRALRPMRDIDILVKPEQLETADQILHDFGYQLVGNKEKYRERHFHYNYQSPKGEVTIEVHWDIQKQRSPFQIDLHEWWQRAETKQIGKTPCLVLSPEDLLIHSSLHLVKHLCQDGFRPIIDVATLIEHPDQLINWPRLITIAQTQQVTKPLYLTLKLAADLLKTTIPPEVMSCLHTPDLAPSTYQWFKQQLQTDGSLHEPVQVSIHLAKLWRTPNPIKKVSILWNMLKLPPDGDLEQPHPTASRSTMSPTLKNRLRRYTTSYISPPVEHNENLENEIDMMYWLSSR